MAIGLNSFSAFIFWKEVKIIHYFIILYDLSVDVESDAWKRKERKSKKMVIDAPALASLVGGRPRSNGERKPKTQNLQKARQPNTKREKMQKQERQSQ